ncbi:hypothetical protein SFRURICE_017619 [Spodoptera frugiperda]|nr:hypothetical protein SFRURICE_017619 [Spodoptera frugiperda]
MAAFNDLFLANWCRAVSELLEKRIKQLEAQLEEEKRRTQRERMAVTKLQNKLIKLISDMNLHLIGPYQQL